MRVALIAAVVLVFISLSYAPVQSYAPVPHGYDFAQAWEHLYRASQSEMAGLEDKHKEEVRLVEEENHWLKTEVERLSEYELIANDFANLKAQVAGLHSNVGTVQAKLFQARTNLQRVLSSTASIETAVGTFISIRISGNSMEPGMTERDLVFVQLPPFTVKVGDVIVSSNPNCPFIHRIVAAVEGGWITKGDNKSKPDNCVVAPSQVIYRKAAIARGVF